MGGVARRIRGRFRNALMRALYELGAVENSRAVDVRSVVQQIKQSPEYAQLPHHPPDGILMRTSTMLLSTVLSDRHGWVAYDKERVSRRFWLTPEGVKELERMKRSG